MGLPQAGLFAVADGLGGHSFGAEASACIIEALADEARAGSIDPGAVYATLERTHGRLMAHAGPGRVIGATVVVLTFAEDGVGVLWAGDSRAYRLRDGELESLTRDHSMAQALAAAGGASADIPHRHIVTRAVGAGERFEPEALRLDWREGDAFLLCSDGLWDVVEEETIVDLLGGAAPQEAAESLLTAALARGAPDNVTAVVARPLRSVL